MKSRYLWMYILALAAILFSVGWQMGHDHEQRIVVKLPQSQPEVLRVYWLQTKVTEIWTGGYMDDVEDCSNQLARGAPILQGIRSDGAFVWRWLYYTNNN